MGGEALNRLSRGAQATTSGAVDRFSVDGKAAAGNQWEVT